MENDCVCVRERERGAVLVFKNQLSGLVEGDSWRATGTLSGCSRGRGHSPPSRVSGPVAARGPVFQTCAPAFLWVKRYVWGWLRRTREGCGPR